MEYTWHGSEELELLTTCGSEVFSFGKGNEYLYLSLDCSMLWNSQLMRTFDSSSGFILRTKFPRILSLSEAGIFWVKLARWKIYMRFGKGWRVSQEPSHMEAWCEIPVLFSAHTFLLTCCLTLLEGEIAYLEILAIITSPPWRALKLGQVWPSAVKGTSFFSKLPTVLKIEEKDGCGQQFILMCPVSVTFLMARTRYPTTTT